MIYLILFYEFCKIGLFALGGGPATLPFLMDLADKYDWYTKEQLADLVAVSQSTPGPLGINMATFAGYHAAGILGAILASLSLVFPSLVIIILVAKFLNNFNEKPVVKGIFYGIRPAVTGLIAVSVINLFEISLFDEVNGLTKLNVPVAILTVVVFFLLQIKQLGKLHPGVWLLAGAAAGILFRL